MNEGIKTLVYVSLAVVVLGGALTIRYWPSGGGPDGDKPIGKELFEEFTDPLRAKSLEISRYDEVTNNVNRFSVNQTGGRWVIPSHANYPADAEQQMQNAATSLIGLEILDVATDDEGEQQKFGVIEPNAEKLKPGATGVGVKISMKDSRGKALAELIIGKPSKNDPSVRFVRVPGEFRIYATRIDLEKLTTKFEDWIEKDLLQLKSSDVGKITFNDYTMETVEDRQTGQRYVQPNKRMQMTVANDASGWQLADLLRYTDRGAPVKQPLAAGEELDTQRIADLTSALDKLEIVDVRRKPQGLGADMKADEGIKLNNESFTSLVAHGFYPATRGEGEDQEIEFLSKNGDLTVETKEGVEYLLRFGDLAVSQDTSQIEQMNRYLMVAARVSEDRFPKPVMPELPPLPEEPAPSDESKPKDADASKDAGASSDDAPAPSEDGAKSDGDEKAADETAGGEESAENKEKSTDDGEAEEKKDDAAADTDRVRIQAARDRIMTQYQRDLDAWKEQRKIASDTVRELNARFGDWYYVISEDVYKQIHLGRAELIKESENIAQEGFGIDAFRLLEERGLRKEPATPPGPPGGGSFPGLPNL
ncbi:MAG: DUF4340 domain-containing protein [Pirellulaceae bacterium]